MRNKKICIICGREFDSPPSDKTVTCSLICRKERARIKRIGKKHSDETKQKMSMKAKTRDMSILSYKATEAAKISPRSGRFITNVNAIDWHLISPEGEHYYFHSLAFWMRENCQELFGCEPDSKEMKNAMSGLRGVKRAMLGKKYPASTYKGWQVIPTEDDIKNK